MPLTKLPYSLPPLLYKAFRQFLSKSDEVAACLFHLFPSVTVWVMVWVKVLYSSFGSSIPL